MTFVWDQTKSLTNGPPNLPANNTPYYWLVLARNAGVDSVHIYPYNTSIAPGDSGLNPPNSDKIPVITPTCAPDLDWVDFI